MVNKQLEIRGITHKELTTYLMQLGAKRDCKYKSYFIGNGWVCILSEEKSFKMFQSIIPSVSVRFEADDEKTLDSIIAQFRKKTFRAGG